VAFSYSTGDPVFGPLQLTVGAGTALGIVGPSGSGKSTLGLMLCGLLSPGRGKIISHGSSGEELSSEATRGQVSMVLQHPERQFFLPTCDEEVAFGPENVGLHLDSDRTSDMLAAVGLEPDQFGARDPFRLSGGEKRRLAFAVVLAMRPRIIVFDEPTCALDQEGVSRFIALANSLKEKGAGVVVISHDGDVIRALADTVLHLDDTGGCQAMTADEFFGLRSYATIVSPLTWSAETT